MEYIWRGLCLATILTYSWISDSVVAVPRVTLNPNPTAYVNSGSSLALTCEVDENVGAYFVYFRKNTIDRIFISNVSSCASANLISNEINDFNVSCNGLKSFIMVQKTVNVGDHDAKWKCFLSHSEGTGPCANSPNPCTSPDVAIFVRVPVSRVQLTDEDGNSLYSPVAVAVGNSTSFRCNTFPNGSRPSAIFRWYKRYGNQLDILIENQFILPTPKPEKVPGQTQEDLVISYSTLMLTGNRSFQDMYIFCAAQNEANSGPVIRSAEIQFNIVYPPIVSLNPTNSVYNVTEGKVNFIMTCDVLDAKPQPQADAFIWRHQGTALQGQTSASYVIPSIQKSDNGQYQCLASNPHGTGISSIMYLNVQYGAEIIKVSVVDGNTVNENSTANISCQVDSNPESYVTWTKQGGLGTLHTDMFVRQSQLIIKYANCLDTGNYTCGASNGLGRPAEKQTPLYVNCYPRSDNRTLLKTIAYGKQYGNASLSYTVISFPEPAFNWFFIRNGSGDRHLPDSAKVYNNGLQSVLMFRNLSINDFGFYSVTAANAFLPSTTQVFQLIQSDVPAVPSNVTVIDVKQTSITIQWVAGYNGGSEQYFNIMIRASDITRSVHVLDPGNGKVGTKLIEDLLPNTEYSITMIAINSIGSSTVTDVIFVSTLKATTTGNGLRIAEVAGGVTAGIVAILLVGIGILFWRRYQHNKKRLYEDELNKELRQSEKPVSGLVANSQHGSLDKDTVVDKSKKKASHEGEIYENATLGGASTNKHNACKNPGKALAESCGNVYDNPDVASSSGIFISEEGLHYADLTLIPATTKKGQPVIIGLEDHTEYAEIAFGKTGKPLPKSDEAKEHDYNGRQ